MSNDPNSAPNLAADVAANLRAILDRESAKRNQVNQVKQQADELAKMKDEVQTLLKALAGVKPAPVDPVQSVSEEVRSLREELAALKADRERANQEATLGAIREQVVQSIRGHKDGYELVRALGAEELVFQTMVDHLKTTGKLLTEQDAAKLVEDNLSKQVDKALAVESVRKRVSAAAGTATQPGSNPAASPALTNAGTSTQASLTPPPAKTGFPDSAAIEAAIKRHTGQ